jgi:hypothetical protein
MFFTPVPSKRIKAENEEKKVAPFIPTVYEHFEAKPVSWEYHVVSVDLLEESLPSVQDLNELGQKGWILASLLNERSSGKGEKVHYYFLRQKDN